MSAPTKVYENLVPAATVTGQTAEVRAQEHQIYEEKDPMVGMSRESDGYSRSGLHAILKHNDSLGLHAQRTTQFTENEKSRSKSRETRYHNEMPRQMDSSSFHHY